MVNLTRDVADVMSVHYQMSDHTADRVRRQYGDIDHVTTEYRINGGDDWLSAVGNMVIPEIRYMIAECWWMLRKRHGGKSERAPGQHTNVVAMQQVFVGVVERQVNNVFSGGLFRPRYAHMADLSINFQLYDLQQLTNGGYQAIVSPLGIMTGRQFPDFWLDATDRHLRQHDSLTLDIDVSSGPEDGRQPADCWCPNGDEALALANWLREALPEHVEQCYNSRLMVAPYGWELSSNGYQQMLDELSD